MKIDNYIKKIDVIDWDKIGEDYRNGKITEKDYAHLMAFKIKNLMRIRKSWRGKSVKSKAK